MLFICQVACFSNQGCILCVCNAYSLYSYSRNSDLFLNKIKKKSQILYSQLLHNFHFMAFVSNRGLFIRQENAPGAEVCAHSWRQGPLQPGTATPGRSPWQPGSPRSGRVFSSCFSKRIVCQVWLVPKKTVCLLDPQSLC